MGLPRPEKYEGEPGIYVGIVIAAVFLVAVAMIAISAAAHIT